MNLNDFEVSHLFHKYVNKENGTVIYWRDCIIQPDMVNGEQGYLWVYEDGSYRHSYRTPEEMD